MPEPIDRPASVTAEIDRDALYAALPTIPRPERPPPPHHLVADLVVRAPALLRH